LSNLAGAEITFRRLQLIEYLYSERGPGGGKGQGKSKEHTSLRAPFSQGVTRSLEMSWLHPTSYLTLPKKLSKGLRS